MAALLSSMPADVPAFVVEFLQQESYPGVVPTSDTPERRQYVFFTLMSWYMRLYVWETNEGVCVCMLRYVSKQVNPLIVPVLSRIIAAQPEDVVGFFSRSITEEAENQQQEAKEGK